jgi:Ca2+/Na+ antiporter
MLIVLGLGLSPYVTFNIAALALVGYLLMSVFVYVRTFVEGVFQISYGKFGPTEVRVILFLLNTLMFFWAGAPAFTTPIGPVTIYDILVGLIALILIALFVANTYRKARELSTIDKTPHTTGPS